MITEDQVNAFRAIETILQPSTIASINASGTRETWKKIDQLIEVLAPLFDIVVEEEVKTP